MAAFNNTENIFYQQVINITDNFLIKAFSLMVLGN